tara:strand:- start:118 stop:330 length:213 start_codon:yes stop_codon:yes gene_type:complete
MIRLPSMSSEQIKINELSQSKNISTKSNRVDINDLMLKVRNEEKKEKKENLVFLGLIGSVIVISGVIASL